MFYFIVKFRYCNANRQLSYPSLMAQEGVWFGRWYHQYTAAIKSVGQANLTADTISLSLTLFIHYYSLLPRLRVLDLDRNIFPL